MVNKRVSVCTLISVCLQISGPNLFCHQCITRGLLHLFNILGSFYEALCLFWHLLLHICFGVMKYCKINNNNPYSGFYILNETTIDRYVRSNTVSFLINLSLCLDTAWWCCFFSNKKHAPSGRGGSLTMHKESPPVKNPFLEDLDKLDVSIYGRNKTDK